MKMRQVLRADMAENREAGQSRLFWPVTDVSRLTGLSISDIEYTFKDHETHLKTYVLVYDPIAKLVFWNR